MKKGINHGSIQHLTTASYPNPEVAALAHPEPANRLNMLRDHTFIQTIRWVINNK